MLKAFKCANCGAIQTYTERMVGPLHCDAMMQHIGFVSIILWDYDGNEYPRELVAEKLK